MVVVPNGAVSGPTEFKLRVSDENLFGVELTATAVGSSTLNDVGSAGFKRPLDLVLIALVAGVFHERIFAEFGAGDTAALRTLRD